MKSEFETLRASRRRTTWAGIAVTAILLGGTMLWSTLARIDGAVIGGGTLVVEGDLKAVQNRSGGTVRELRVREGDFVSAGDVIIQLDDAEVRSKLGVIEIRLAATAIHIARLRAERNGSWTFTAPAMVKGLLDPADLEAQIASERDLFAARHAQYEGRRRELSEELAQVEEQVRGSERYLEGLREQEQLIDDDLRPTEVLFAKGLVTKARLSQLRKSRVAARGDIVRLNSDLARLSRRHAGLEVSLKQVDKDRLAEITEDLRQSEATLAELDESRKAAVAALENMTVRAPETGYIHQLAIHTVGGVMPSGTPVAYIVPEGANLIAEVLVAPRDVDQVRVGAPARVKIQAGNQRLMPMLNGKVFLVDRDASEDPASGVRAFRIRIRLADGEEAPVELSAGMSVEGFVTTASYAPLDYLVKPLKEQFSHAWRER